MAKQDRLDKLQELVAHFDEAMLVTHAPDGALRGRPMLVAGIEDEVDIWFITAADSGKVGEILRDERVLVAMQGDRRYLSLTGRAVVVPDQGKLNQLWQPRHDSWFEHGVDDPRAVLIRFHCERAEYWDRSGVKGLLLALELLAATEPGRAASPSPDEERHAKVEVGN